MFGQHPGYFKAVFLKQTRIINARYSDISVDCNDFEARFLITYRKIKFYTAKINDIWTKNEINNNNNHKAS
jgi:hypothetical protein